MLYVCHNGKELTVDAEGFHHLGALVAAQLQNMNGHVLTRLWVDEREINEEELERLETLSLTGVESVRLESESAREVALKVLKSSAEYAGAVRVHLEEIATLLRRGKLDTANQLLADSCDALSVLVHSITGAAAQLNKDTEEIQKITSELTPWLKALVAAQEESDWVRVADYLEFEVAPQLEHWQRVCRSASDDRMVKE